MKYILIKQLAWISLISCATISHGAHKQKVHPSAQFASSLPEKQTKAPPINKSGQAHEASVTTIKKLWEQESDKQQPSVQTVRDMIDKVKDLALNTMHPDTIQAFEDLAALQQRVKIIGRTGLPGEDLIVLKRELQKEIDKKLKENVSTYLKLGPQDAFDFMFFLGNTIFNMESSWLPQEALDELARKVENFPLKTSHDEQALRRLESSLQTITNKENSRKKLRYAVKDALLKKELETAPFSDELVNSTINYYFKTNDHVPSEAVLLLLKNKIAQAKLPSSSKELARKVSWFDALLSNIETLAKVQEKYPSVDKNWPEANNFLMQTIHNRRRETIMACLSHALPIQKQHLKTITTLLNKAIEIIAPALGIKVQKSFKDSAENLKTLIKEIMTQNQGRDFTSLELSPKEIDNLAQAIESMVEALNAYKAEFDAIYTDVIQPAEQSTRKKNEAFEDAASVIGQYVGNVRNDLDDIRGAILFLEQMNSLIKQQKPAAKKLHHNMELLLKNYSALQSKLKPTA